MSDPGNPPVRITLEHTEGLRFTGCDDKGTRLAIDGSGEGTPSGLRPMGLILAALGTCTAIDVVLIMEKKRQPLTRYRIEVTGERAEKPPRRYTRIRVVHHVSGPGIERASVETAVRLSSTTYCSVGASLNAEIEHEVVIETL